MMTSDAVPAPPASSMLPEPDPLPGLRSDFPAFRIWQEDICGRVRYVARRQRRDLHPFAIVTDDPDELRAALAPARETGLVPLSTETAVRPLSARARFPGGVARKPNAFPSRQP